MTAETTPHHPRWKRIVATVLIVVSCVLAPLTVAAIWVRNQVLDTDRYVETVTPLASNPAIIDAAAANITETLFQHVNVEKEAREALPKRAKFLAGPLSVGIRGFTEQAAVRILESDVFEKIWVDANRLAHNQVESALTGRREDHLDAKRSGDARPHGRRQPGPVVAPGPGHHDLQLDPDQPARARSSSCSTRRSSVRRNGESSCSTRWRGCCRSWCSDCSVPRCGSPPTAAARSSGGASARRSRCPCSASRSRSVGRRTSAPS